MYKNSEKLPNYKNKNHYFFTIQTEGQKVEKSFKHYLLNDLHDQLISIEDN